MRRKGKSSCWYGQGGAGPEEQHGMESLGPGQEEKFVAARFGVGENQPSLQHNARGVFPGRALEY